MNAALVLKAAQSLITVFLEGLCKKEMLLLVGWNAFALPLGPVTAVRAVLPSTSLQDKKTDKRHTRPGTFKASAPTSVQIHGREALP